MTRLVVITNFQAGRNRTRPETIRGLLEAAGADILEASDLASIRAATRDAVARDPEILAVNGGDGTVHGVFTELMRATDRLPDLAVIPGGTTNMTANDLNANAPLEDSIRSLGIQTRRMAAHRRRVYRPFLRVTGVNDDPQYGFFLGAGVILDGMEHFRSKVGSLGLRGEVAAGISLLQGLAKLSRSGGESAEGHKTAFQVDGSQSPRSDQILVMATSLERMLLGLTPWWGTQTAPIHMTALRRKPRSLLRRAPALLRGRPHSKMSDGDGYYSENVTGFELRPDGAFALDGEIFAVGAEQPVRVVASDPVAFLRLDHDD
ncbi:MAG: hypothetical protein JSW21_03835 [Gammaproteobacteria bacterium]|nr:MAG: hypothetical protein JSW21_03835 [Gammaproteobacteria bacterium]